MFKSPEHMDIVEHASRDTPAFIDRAVSHLAALGMRTDWSGHADHYGQQTEPIRATDDVDIAVAVRTDEQFLELSGMFARRGKAPHKFNVLGVEVDIVPFGGNEADRTVTFTDGNLLDVTAASYHYAHIAAQPFSPQDGMAVLDILRDPTQREMLIRHMRNPLAGELLTAYSRGFEAGLRR